MFQHERYVYKIISDVTVFFSFRIQTFCFKFHTFKMRLIHKEIKKHHAPKTRIPIFQMVRPPSFTQMHLTIYSAMIFLISCKILLPPFHLCLSPPVYSRMCQNMPFLAIDDAFMKKD